MMRMLARSAVAGALVGGLALWTVFGHVSMWAVACAAAIGAIVDIAWPR
jgi:hypothetical protein